MPTTILGGATIFDGTGRAPFTGTIEIENDRILSVTPSPAAAGEGWGEATLIDASGLYVVPGLIDAHVHVGVNRVDEGSATDWHIGEHPALSAFRAQSALRDFLHLGITAVRNAGSLAHLDIAVREAEHEGLAEISRVYAAGSVITVPGEHLHKVGRPVTGMDDLKAAVQDEIAAGVDLIKVAASGPFTRPGALFGEAELRTIVEIAHGAGKTVAAHAENAESIRNAVLAGVDSIEHASWLTTELAELMAKHRTCLVPTFLRLRLKHPDYQQPGWRFSEPQHAAAKQAFGPYVEGLFRAVELGVPMALGTDTYCTVLDELDALSELGVARDVLLAAATRGGAKVLNEDTRIGTLEPGKLADLLVLRSDPLADTRALRNPAFVLKNGRPVTLA